MASFDVEVRIDVDAGSGCEAYDRVYDQLALAGVENFSVREVVDENYEEVDLSAENATCDFMSGVWAAIFTLPRRQRTLQRELPRARREPQSPGRELSDSRAADYRASRRQEM